MGNERTRTGTSPVFDCVIVGAGPAGLTAGIYLSRFRRKVVIVDRSGQRAMYIPSSRNLPGFPKGIKGSDLLDSMRRQGEQYGAFVTNGNVTNLKRLNGDRFAACLEDGTIINTKHILLATGGTSRLPQAVVANGSTWHNTAVMKALLRYCPICDGFEAIGCNIAVVGDGEHALSEAKFLLTYTKKITLISESGNVLPEYETCEHSGIIYDRRPLFSVQFASEGGLRCWHSGSAEPAHFDVLYSALGTDYNVSLALQLGCKLSDTGAVLVDEHQMSSVPNVWAAGDVVHGIDQICVAQAHAAIACTRIHNELRK